MTIKSRKKKNFVFLETTYCARSIYYIMSIQVILFLLNIDSSFMNSTGANRFRPSFMLVHPYYYTEHHVYSLILQSLIQHCYIYIYINQSQGGVQNDPIQLYNNNIYNIKKNDTFRYEVKFNSVRGTSCEHAIVVYS